MVNCGKMVLYGAVADVQRRWAPNAVVVRGRGDFARVPGVARVDERDGHAELWLDDATEPHAVLRTLVNRPDVALDSFEIATSSLDDIFIAVVEGRQRVERRADTHPAETVDVYVG